MRLLSAPGLLEKAADHVCLCRFVGVGAKRIRELFAAAKKKSPAIIFIDELDSVGGKRSNKDQAALKQTVNQLLTELDGFQASTGIIVIASVGLQRGLA